jgi:hypothetical protein
MVGADAPPTWNEQPQRKSLTGIPMAKMTDEQRRALRVLARHPHGCSEAMLLDQGFTAVQLGELIFAGFAKIRAAGRQRVFLVKITAAGRNAIAG